jgi:putative transcriptional regulator
MTGFSCAGYSHAALALAQPFAAGQLGPGAALVYREHIRACERCGSHTRALEAAAGSLFEAEEGVALSEGALETALARLEAPAPPPSDSPRLAHVPQPLQAAFASAESKGWRFAGFGLSDMVLEVPEAQAHGETLRVLRIAPGHGAPRHGHEGLELTLVLTGAFRDQSGVYGPGGLSVATPDIVHRPVAEPGETCLALAVEYAPLRFQGLTGLAQRLLTGWRR